MSFDPPPLPPAYGPLQVWWEQVRTGLKNELGALAAAQAAQATATAAATSAANAATAAANAATTAANAATAAANAATAASTAQSTANTAQSSANTAQTTATTVQRNDSIADSFTVPGTILSASDAGSNATITISGHTRTYNDGSSVSVSGGSVTGLSYSTTYYVYYDQTSRAGGSVTYHATTDAKSALPGFAAGRHLCGNIATPASGGGATSGGYTPPSGAGIIPPGSINP